MRLDLSGLEEFGQAADQLQQPALVEGGFLVLGNGSTKTLSQRRENGGPDVERGPRAEEARPPAGSRQGRSAPSPATGAAAHPVERGLSGTLRLEELFAYHPDARWVGSSSGSARLLVPVGLFRTIPEWANLLFEIPTHEPAWLRERPAGHAPFIRAWAQWSFGLPVRAHHEYPDQSMCVCREGDWVLDRHVIEDYVGYCACWVAKALHERLLGWWPGLQHCPAASRVERGRPYEYCGCGKPALYHVCCRSKDLARTWSSRAAERAEADRKYLREIVRRGLSSERPAVVIDRAPDVSDLFALVTPPPQFGAASRPACSGPWRSRGSPLLWASRANGRSLRPAVENRMDPVR